MRVAVLHTLTVVGLALFVTVWLTNYSEVALHAEHEVESAEADLLICRAGAGLSPKMQAICHEQEHVVQTKSFFKNLIKALRMTLVPHPVEQLFAAAVGDRGIIPNIVAGASLLAVAVLCIFFLRSCVFGRT